MAIYICIHMCASRVPLEYSSTPLHDALGGYSTGTLMALCALCAGAHEARAPATSADPGESHLGVPA